MRILQIWQKTCRFWTHKIRLKGYWSPDGVVGSRTLAVLSWTSSAPLIGFLPQTRSSLFASPPIHQKSVADGLSSLFQKLSSLLRLIDRRLPPPLLLPPPPLLLHFEMTQVGQGCLSATARRQFAFLMRSFLLVLSPCTSRPPVLSEVLPGAHGASQGSVVAVHRV